MQSNKYFNATMREIRTQKTVLDSSRLPNGEFRTPIDYCDESGDIPDRHAEIWYFPNWESMAEG